MYKRQVEQGYLTREEIGDLDAPIRRELIARLAARALKLEPSQGKSPFADCLLYTSPAAESGVHLVN